MEEYDIDELNELEDRRSIPYDEYFDNMDLTEEEKEKRKSFAEKLDDVMLFIFGLIIVMNKYNKMNKEYIRNQMYERFSDVVLEFMGIDDYLANYISLSTDEILDTTYRNIDDNFFLSLDRAMLISENEANGVFGYDEFVSAIRQGKTMKEWVDVRDHRERKTHLAVGGKKIPILQPFVVGNSLMLFPKDRVTYSADMKEIAGCRCTVRYY